MDEEITLKPCPFCGKEASPNGVIRRASSPDCRWADDTECREAFYCNCMSCGANNGGIVGGYQTRDKAVSHWNTRAVLASRWRPITDPPNAGERVFVWSGGLPHVGLYSPESQAYFFDCDTYGIRKEEAEAWMPVNPPAHPGRSEERDGLYG